MGLIGWTVHNRKYLKRKKKKKKQKNTNFPFGIKIEYPTYIQKKRKESCLTVEFYLCQHSSPSKSHDPLTDNLSMW